MNREPATVSVYRSLTCLYPRSFRREYRADLVQLFRDQCHDEPVVRVSARAAIDLLITIPTEHLEARMNRPPNAIVPLFFAAASVAGVILALLGGSEPAAVIIGICVAIGAGALASLSWRRAAPARADGPSISRSWWKFLLGGPAVLAIGGVQQLFEVGNWYLWIVMVLTALVVTAIGLVLALVELFSHRSHPSAV